MLIGCCSCVELFKFVPKEEKFSNYQDYKNQNARQESRSTSKKVMLILWIAGLAFSITISSL